MCLRARHITMFLSSAIPSPIQFEKQVLTNGTFKCILYAISTSLQSGAPGKSVEDNFCKSVALQKLWRREQVCGSGSLPVLPQISPPREEQAGSTEFIASKPTEVCISIMLEAQVAAGQLTFSPRAPRLLGSLIRTSKSPLSTPAQPLPEQTNPKFLPETQMTRVKLSYFGYLKIHLP